MAKDKAKKKKKHKKKSHQEGVEKAAAEPTEEELRASKAARLLEQSMNPNYLKDSPRSPMATGSSNTDGMATPVEDIPVQNIDLGNVSLNIPGLASADQYLNISHDSSDHGGEATKKAKKKKKKKKHRQSTASEDSVDVDRPSVMVSKNWDMPEGAEEGSDGEGENDGHLPPDDPHRALADVKIDDLDYQEPYKPNLNTNSTTWQRGFAGEDASIPTSLFGEGASKSKKKKKRSEDREIVAKEGNGQLAGKTDKHKKKKKHKKEVDNEFDNGDGLDEKEDSSHKSKKKKKKSKEKDTSTKASVKKPEKEVPDTDDIEFWLSQEAPAP